MEKERLIGIREINSLGIVVLRFVLHVSLRSHVHIPYFFSNSFLIQQMSMWHGQIRNKEYITKLITCRPQDVQAFLRDHMRLNLRQLAKILGKNEEHAQLFLHKVLLQMSRANDQPKNNDWNNKATITAWESVI